jgi:ferredoxin-NADP reductase
MPLIGDDDAQQQVFLCGPDGMMTAVERILLDAGVPSDRISLERFQLV